MTYSALLPETCTIHRKTVDTSKKTTTEEWFPLETVKCRVLTKNSVKSNVEKTQYATLVRKLFAVPKFASVAIRDRISHGGRMYDVVDVVTTYARTSAHHKVAVCEVFAGAA